MSNHANPALIQATIDMHTARRAWDTNHTDVNAHIYLTAQRTVENLRVLCHSNIKPCDHSDSNRNYRPARALAIALA